MIMSCLATIEMSSFGNAIMLFYRGHGTKRRIKAVTRDPESSGEGYQSGRGRRDSFPKQSADSKGRQADKA